MDKDTVLHHIVRDCLDRNNQVSCHIKEIVEKVLAQNFDLINHKNCEGDTPLHIAVRKGDLDYAWTLLQMGADRSIRNKHTEASPGVRPMGELSYLKETLDDYKMKMLIQNIQNSSLRALLLKESDEVVPEFWTILENVLNPKNNLDEYRSKAENSLFPVFRSSSS